MRSITTQHIRTHGYDSAKAFKEAFGLESLKCGAMRAKQSAFLKGNNPTEGRGHSEESRAKMRENRKGKGVGVAGKYERTPEIRAKIRDGVLRAWEKGKRGRGRYCYSTKLKRKVWVRSSWEERVVKVLDKHPLVESFTVEPFRIPYEFEGQTRHYIPDFLVNLSGGVAEVWEVKPKRLLTTPRNAAKVEALNTFATERGLNSRLVTRADIGGMEKRAEYLEGFEEWRF